MANNYSIGLSLIGLTSCYLIYKNRLNIIDKLIDKYVDIKYYFNNSNKIYINNNTNNFNNINKDLIFDEIKIDEYNFICVDKYIICIHTTNYNQDIIQKLYNKYLSYNLNNISEFDLNFHNFNIIFGADTIKNKELFLEIINKFAGYECDFHNFVPNCNILNLYDQRLDLKSKIIIENSNYEQFVIEAPTT